MRDYVAILRAYAHGYDVSGPQYAPMAADLREAADALALALTPPVPECAVGGGRLVFDSDGVPVAGRLCPDCED